MPFYEELIAKIRTDCPSYQNRVGGTAEFEALRQQGASIATPFCFVVPMGRNLQKLQGNSKDQPGVQEFATIICVDNKVRNLDGQQLQPITQVEALIQELINALSGFNPTSLTRSFKISFSDDFHLEMLENRMWHQAIWSIPITGGSLTSIFPVGYPIQDIFIYGNAVDQTFDFTSPTHSFEDGSIPEVDYADVDEIKEQFDGDGLHPSE